MNGKRFIIYLFTFFFIFFAILLLALNQNNWFDIFLEGGFKALYKKWCHYLSYPWQILLFKCKSTFKKDILSLKFLKNNFCIKILKEGNFMNKITKLMIQNPFISMLLIFPFSLAIVIGLFSIILDIILPFVMAGFMTYLTYNYVIGKSNNETMKDYFTYIYKDYK